MNVTHAVANVDPTSHATWWREAEWAWLIVLVVAAYFLRAGALPLRGEEPTRAQIAWEMVEGHDWLVPKRMGETFGIRPPLQNWVIAASCVTLDSWSEWAVRAPSMLATLLTTLMIYGYGRTFLSRLGAFAAAAAFATLADMFAMGRQAETEAVFIVLVSGSLLVWHWGLTCRWPDALTFSAGYGLMALAMLTKGMQAPCYFICSTWIYLLVTRQWRRLLSFNHLLGALVGAGIVLAWVIPYYLTMGWSESLSIWFGDPVMMNSGIRHWNPRETTIHFFTLPLEVVAGTLPWSLLLLLYLSRSFRRSIQGAGPHVLFAWICLAVAFPTCWVPPGGRVRFFAPLFPSLAILIGLAIERCTSFRAHALARLSPAESAETTPTVNPAWNWFLLFVAGAMGAFAVWMLTVALLAPFVPTLAPFSGPPLRTLVYISATLLLAMLVLRVRGAAEAARVRLAVLGVAGFMVLAFSGVFLDARVRLCEDAPAAMRRLKEKLPPGQELVSISGQIDCRFPFYYGRPAVRLSSWPQPGHPSDLTYFCFNQCPGGMRPTLPFAWEEIGAISLDRNHHAVPDEEIVVGRRLVNEAALVSGR